LTYTEIHEMLSARRAGASFDRALTLGRQNLYLHRKESAALIEEFGLAPEVDGLSEPFGTYADDFLRTALLVGALDSMDVSSYEGAAILHDLNVPVARDLEQCFDAVIDGGTLEHIFNIPVALSNVMRMTKVGGRVFLANPANNLCGHGFFQFSPELMFRTFSSAHGFAVERVALMEAQFPGIELVPRRGLYEVNDPEELGVRVTLVSRHPIMLVVHARKLNHLSDPLRVTPQQSDYMEMWNGEGAAPATIATGQRHHERSARYLFRKTARSLSQKAPPKVERRIRGYQQRMRASLRNRRFYTKALTRR
jgi:hypothetical protein